MGGSVWSVEYLGFHFGGGGGFKIFFGKVGVSARGKATRLLWGLIGGMPSRESFLNGAIWCVLENILLKFCKKKCKNIYFYIKIIIYNKFNSIFRGKILEHILPRFLVNYATWRVLKHIFRELSLKKIYINSNDIDMLLLCTNYII